MATTAKCGKKNCGKKSCSKNKRAHNSKNSATPTLATKASQGTRAAVVPLEAGVAFSNKSQPRPKVVTESATFTAERIQKNADTFFSMYSRYEAVRELAKRLNGLPQSGPLPSSVTFNKIEFNFVIDGKEYSVDMAEIKSVLEITPLIANTLSVFLEKMYQEIFSLNNIGSAMQRAIEQAIVKPVTPNTQISLNAEKS